MLLLEGGVALAQVLVLHLCFFKPELALVELAPQSQQLILFNPPVLFQLSLVLFDFLLLRLEAVPLLLHRKLDLFEQRRLLLFAGSCCPDHVFQLFHSFL